MKKLIFILATLLLTGVTSNAKTPLANTKLSTINYNGYGNSFIFIEGGIEFSVFPDGQFDFNMLRTHSQLSVSIGAPHVNISFNSGYDYNAYVQYDEFGAVIQIENIPIYYDYYGRIVQAGNVNIYYNDFGYISRVGGLYVHYNPYHRFSHCTGFINVYNRHYAYRPWHRYYTIPAYDYCVVYNRPYRQHYTPVRYVYTRPFYNNYRPPTSVATRRGSSITRNRSYATVNRSSQNKTSINRQSTARRNYTDVNRGRNVKRPVTSKSRDYMANRNTGRVTRSNSHASSNSTRRNNVPINYTKRIHNSVKRTTVANVKDESRISADHRTRNNSVNRKPKNTNVRTYTRDNSITRQSQTVNGTTQIKPKTVKRSVFRSINNNARVTQNKSYSRDKNTRSAKRRS